ncbi:MAG: hypothetical protein VSS75_019780 [Candidatus Parabeggiatoa sp.]|nr:hypothetical protein [Candidatus Parabeggiatoa sp.]
MEKFKEKQFTSRYNKIMLLTLLVVLAVSAALVTLKVYIETKYEDAQLIEQFKTRSIAIDNLIVSITEHLNAMQMEAEAFFLDAENNSKLFQALSNIDEGSYSLDNIPPPYSKANLGNLTGAGNISHISQSLREEIEMSLTLNSLFQATKENIPNAAWVYYTSKNNFINIYPWTHSANFRFSEELFTHEFYTLGLPAVNSEKEIFWTSAYIDEYGKGMMVTAAKPIYRGKIFLGTVAIDITLDELTDYVQNFRSSSDILMILNEKKQLIAHPTLVTSIDTEIKWFKNALPESLQPEKDNLFKTKLLQLDKLGNYLHIWYQMKNAPWKIIFISEEPHILVRVFSTVGIIFIALLGGLSFMLVNIKKLTFREFIHPAENLVRHIYQESEDKLISIPNVPYQWIPWFEEISRTFAQNRNLIEEIKQKNEQLTEMNISLERYMPKFILIINLRDGCGGTMIGNFFADSLSKLDTSKTTVYMEYPVPEKISTDFGLDSTQHIYNHPNGYDVWSSYDLGEIPEEAKTSLLMTKVLNNYNNIVINTMVQGSVEEFIHKDIEPMFRYAKAIVLMVPPDGNSSENEVQKVISEIRKHVRQDQTNVYKLLNKIEENVGHTSEFDFEIPFLTGNFRLSKEKFVVPEQALSVISTLVDRVERVHQISVYIPTTIDIDKTIDTSDYVRRTMVFLGEKFGGATSSEAQGVWNSDTSGIVSEAVYIVVTYTTEDDLNRFVDDVIEFVKDIKKELSQDAMAVEINKKMLLI